MSKCIETGLIRLTKWIWKLIPKMRWCTHLNDRSVIFNEEAVGGREKVTTDEEASTAKRSAYMHQSSEDNQLTSSKLSPVINISRQLPAQRWWKVGSCLIQHDVIACALLILPYLHKLWSQLDLFKNYSCRYQQAQSTAYNTAAKSPEHFTVQLLLGSKLWRIFIDYKLLLVTGQNLQISKRYD